MIGEGDRVVAKTLDPGEFLGQEAAPLGVGHAKTPPHPRRKSYKTKPSREAPALSRPGLRRATEAPREGREPLRLALEVTGEGVTREIVL